MHVRNVARETTSDHNKNNNNNGRGEAVRHSSLLEQSENNSSSDDEELLVDELVRSMLDTASRFMGFFDSSATGINNNNNTGEQSASSSQHDPSERSTSDRETFPSLLEDIFPGVPDTFESSKTDDDDDSKLQSTSYRSVRYEVSSDDDDTDNSSNNNENGNVNQDASGKLFHDSFRDIPYEESSIGAMTPCRHEHKDVGSSSPLIPRASEGSLVQGIPYEHHHGSSFSSPDDADCTFPGVPLYEPPLDTAPDGIFSGGGVVPYESERLNHHDDPRGGGGSNNLREAFPSLPSDTFPGVPVLFDDDEEEEPSKSESSLRQENSIIRQACSTPPTEEQTNNNNNKIRSRKRVQDIFSEIDSIDIDKIKLRPDTTKYLETLNGYLKCFERLQEVYEQVDQDRVLANHKIIINSPNDNDDIRQTKQSSSSSSLPPQQSQYGNQVRNIVELYDVAALVLPVYISKIRGLVATVKRELKSDDIYFLLPPGENKLKGRRRALEKAQKYNNTKKKSGAPESWLYDIVRGSVVFGDASQLLYFLDRLQKDKSIKIIKSKNRFQNPTLSGYRDWNLQIQFSAVVHLPRNISNSNNNHRGLEESCRKVVPHICELQLHHKAIKGADTELGSHHYYEFLREYYNGSTGSLEERLEDLRMISDYGGKTDNNNNNNSFLNLTFLKQVIQNPVGLDRMNRLATLFADHVNDYRLAMVIVNATRRIDMKNIHAKLGKILKKQGRLQDAMEMYLVDLDIRLNTTLLGNNKNHNNEDIQLAYNNIATVLSEQRRYEQAMNMYKKSLKIKLEVLGRDHADTAKTYNGMALVLGHQGKYDESMAMHKEALDIQLKVLGQGHPDTAASYFGLGSTLQKKKKGGISKRALKMYGIALRIRLKALGRDHPDVATVYWNIGNILLEQNKYREAKNTFQQAIDIRIKTLGLYHSLTAQAYHSLSKTHYSMALVFSKEQNRLDDALRLFQQALDIQIKIHGSPTHPAAGRIYKTMARVLEKQLKRDEAKKMLQLARKCK